MYENFSIHVVTYEPAVTVSWYFWEEVS